MTKEFDNPRPAGGAALSESPRFIILLDDWGEKIAGRVLQADADTLSALDVESVSWRAATDLERRIAGFID